MAKTPDARSRFSGFETFINQLSDLGHITQPFFFVSLAAQNDLSWRCALQVMKIQQTHFGISVQPVHGPQLLDYEKGFNALSCQQAAEVQ